MTFRDYYQVRDWLENFIPLVYGKEELGLSRIENLLKLIGNPERKFKSIQIAGTSGKGSTAFYTAKLLQMVGTKGQRDKVDRGYKGSGKIGLHISPHLIDIRERMQIFSSSVIPAKVYDSNYKFRAGIQKSAKDWILDQALRLRSGQLKGSELYRTVENDNVLMPMDRFIRLMSEIRVVVEKIQKEKTELTPSYFEILVAASFKYFAEEKVDWAVVEVGLGGRFDATNVLQPEISVITNIGLDHTEILGKTVERIALEKAGIIKEKVPVVTGASGKGLKVIQKISKENGSKVVKINTQKSIKDLSIQSYSTGPLLAFSTLSTLGFSFKGEDLKKVFSLKFPGRFEEIDEGVVLDGAHNPDKIKALIGWLRSTIDYRRSTIVLVVAFKKGKNWQQMIDLLLKNLPIKEVIASKYQAVTDTGKGSAVEPEEIAEYVMSIVNRRSTIVKIFENSQEAVFEVLRPRSGSSTLVLVTGSLYLVGEVRTMWELPDF